MIDNRAGSVIQYLNIAVKKPQSLGYDFIERIAFSVIHCQLNVSVRRWIWFKTSETSGKCTRTE